MARQQAGDQLGAIGAERRGRAVKRDCGERTKDPIRLPFAPLAGCEEKRMGIPIRQIGLVALIAVAATACQSGGSAQHFALGTKNSEPAGITTGPDGRVLPASP